VIVRLLRDSGGQQFICWELLNFSPDVPSQSYAEPIYILPGEAFVVYNRGSNALTYNIYGAYYPQFHSIPGPDGLQLPGIS
jgi:hypothetical protein